MRKKQVPQCSIEERILKVQDAFPDRLVHNYEGFLLKI